MRSSVHFLIQWLTGEGLTQHDFGREVLPSLVEQAQVTVTTFRGIGRMSAPSNRTLKRTWRSWAKRPRSICMTPIGSFTPAAKNAPRSMSGSEARVDGNLLTDGCRIDGTVTRSIIGPGVYVAPRRDCPRFHFDERYCLSSEGAVLDRVITDKAVSIGAGAHVGGGDDNTPNQELPTRLNTGITVIGKHTQIPARHYYWAQCRN